MGSDIKGFYKLTVEERLARLVQETGLSMEDLDGIRKGSTSMEILDGMIENVIGTFEIPVGIATNFVINGKDVIIPMATEEPSVIAAASKAAKIARIKGGFRAKSSDPVMIGQVQVIGVPDPGAAVEKIKAAKIELMELANTKDPMLVKFGGGCKEIRVRYMKSYLGHMIVIHLLVDCRDAMGANAVNTMAEAVSPEIERITGGKVVLRIISNLAVHRISKASAVFSKDEVGGEEGVDLILWAQSLAKVDPFRATTHNKGVMNGISAVVRATGNDTRAVESGVHAYACYERPYGPVTEYTRNDEGDLVGNIDIPVPVGIVGGTTKVHPSAKASLKILGVKTSRELGEVIACVGLAQNFAALRVLSKEGIQRGHMKLHARNLALQAGARNKEIDEIVFKMIRSGKVTASSAVETLEKMRAGQ